jgi:uncharacterized protein YjdB
VCVCVDIGVDIDSVDSGQYTTYSICSGTLERYIAVIEQQRYHIENSLLKEGDVLGIGSDQLVQDQQRNLDKTSGANIESVQTPTIQSLWPKHLSNRNEQSTTTLHDKWRAIGVDGQKHTWFGLS